MSAINKNNTLCVIFSKDRPMQLDATLSSLVLHCEDIDNLIINVLYKATSNKLKQQYKQLISYYKDVVFTEEIEFQNDLLNIIYSFSYSKNSKKIPIAKSLNKLIILIKKQKSKIIRHFYVKLLFPAVRFFSPIPKKTKYILFCVDDNIFVNKFSISEIVNSLHKTTKAIAFSLRLGKNTKYCYMHNTHQALPEFQSINNRISQFNWVHSQLDFNYPLEISSSVYRMENLLPLLNAIAFINPNSLEGEIASRKKYFSKALPTLLVFNTSVAFCNPVNIVQKTAPKNRRGEKSAYSADELSNLFERNMRINVANFSGLITNACHQEMDLHFSKLEAE